MHDSRTWRQRTGVKTLSHPPTLPIAQKINLEQVRSPEMPRLVSPVIFVRYIDPFLQIGSTRPWTRPQNK